MIETGNYILIACLSTGTVNVQTFESAVEGDKAFKAAMRLDYEWIELRYGDQYTEKTYRTKYVQRRCPHLTAVHNNGVQGVTVNG